MSVRLVLGILGFGGIVVEAINREKQRRHDATMQRYEHYEAGLRRDHERARWAHEAAQDRAKRARERADREAPGSAGWQEANQAAEAAEAEEYEAAETVRLIERQLATLAATRPDSDSGCFS